MHHKSLIFDVPLQSDDLRHHDILAIECKLIKDKSEVGDNRTDFMVQRVARLVKVADWSGSDQ